MREVRKKKKKKAWSDERYIQSHPQRYQSTGSQYGSHGEPDTQE